MGEEREKVGMGRKEEGWEVVLVVGFMEEIRVLGKGEDEERVEE